MKGRTLGAEFAADAALLEAAERTRHVEDRSAVDGDDTGADLAGDLGGPVDVGGPHRARESVVGIVGDGDRLLDGGVPDARQHRPEDLLASDGHVVGDPGEHGGLHIETLPERAVERAAGHGDGTGCLARLEVATDFLVLTARDERTEHHVRVGRIPVQERADGSGECFDDLVVAVVGTRMRV